MLRTIFVAIIILVGMAYAIRKPFWALLFYVWLAYFRPEQWVWNDWVSSLNLSYYVGILLLFSTVLSGERRFHLSHRTWMIVAFGLQCILASTLSNYSEYAWFYLKEFLKVLLVTYLITVLVDNFDKLRQVILVMCLSLGMEAAKQGWANFVRNPGAANNNPIPFLGDNNGVAIGMLMLMPLVMALAQTTTIRRNKIAYRFLGVGVFIRGLTTYSRGAFLSVAAWAAFYLLRTKRKVTTVIAMAIVGYIAFSVMPDEYWDRMRTVESTGDERDDSAKGRLHYWVVALEMAKDRPITGVGFNAFSQAYDEYDPARGAMGNMRTAHSTWFGTLGDLGYPGLGLLIMLLLTSTWGCYQVERVAKRTPGLEDLAPFALATQSSFIVMMVGGTFLHMQYSEMLWHLFGLSMAMQRITAEALVPVVEPSPGGLQTRPGAPLAGSPRPAPHGTPPFTPRPRPAGAAFSPSPRDRRAQP